MGIGGFISRGQRPGREAHRSTPNNAEVKKIWIYTSTPPYASMALCLISKHRANFTFTFTAEEL
jgi:hypothetical protein